MAHASDRRPRLLMAAFATTLILSACGGGGGGGGSKAPPPPPAPSGLSYPSPQSLRLNAAMTALTPTVTGSVASYSVSPSLPAGITLNGATGQISGTPTATAATATYTVTAGNTGGSTTFGLSLKVITVEVSGGTLTRFAAEHSPIYPEVVLRPVNFDAGTLYATATDPNGLVLQPVSVTARGDGSYSLILSTNPSVSPAIFNGSLTLNLYRDAAGTQPQEVPDVSVPFKVTVVGASTAWPGDHPTALASWPGVPDWSTMQGNAAHTGHVPASVNPDAFTLRWKTSGNQLWNPWVPLKPNLVTANGLFFVVSSDYLQNGVVYAKRESDGSEVWHYDVAGMQYPSANPVTVSNGVVYFAAGHQNETFVIARNATDGSPVFRTALASQWEGYYSPTVGPNGMVYLNAGTYGGVYGFNPAGNQLFFAGASQVSNWTPAVTASAVYAYTGDKLQLLDPLTGVAGVTIPDPNNNSFSENGGAPVLGDAALGSVFGANYTWGAINSTGIWRNLLTNFRTTNGTIAWQASGSFPTTPAYRSGVVYAVNEYPVQFEARAEGDGELLWSWAPANAGETSFVSEVLLTDTHAFVSTNYATHAIDLATHKPTWSYPVSGKLALSANGILYIHNNTDLVAVNLK